MFKPQCVPAVQSKAETSWCFHSEILSAFVLSTYVCAHVNEHTFWSFFFSFSWPSLYKSGLIPVAPHPVLSFVAIDQSLSRFRPGDPGECMQCNYFLLKPLFFSVFFFIPQTKQELKTDVVVCFRHAKQLKPTPRSGCDIPWVSGAMHILLAEPRY